MDRAVVKNWAPSSPQAFPLRGSLMQMTLGHFLEASFVCLFHKSPEESLFCYSFPPHLKSQKEKKFSEFTIRFLVQLQLTEL